MSSVFTLIPRPIYEFAGMDMTARYAFGLIYDRLRLSARNRENYTDAYGLYCVFSRETMAAEMGVTIPTLRKAVKELTDRGLIASRIASAGGSWRYYLMAKARDSLAMQDMTNDCIYEPPEYNTIVDPL